MIPKNVIWCANTGFMPLKHDDGIRSALDALPRETPLYITSPGVRDVLNLVLSNWVTVPKGHTSRWSMFSIETRLAEMTKRVSATSEYVKAPAIDICHNLDVAKYVGKLTWNRFRYDLEHPIVYACTPLKTVFKEYSPGKLDRGNAFIHMDENSRERSFYNEMSDALQTLLPSGQKIVTRPTDTRYVSKLRLKECELVNADGSKFSPSEYELNCTQYDIAWTMRVAACGTPKLYDQTRITVSLHPIIGVVLRSEPLTSVTLINTLQNFNEDMDDAEMDDDSEYKEWYASECAKRANKRRRA